MIYSGHAVPQRARRRYQMIYFDHNATTPVLPEARAAWLEATDEFIGNPSSPHRIGGRADAALQRAREAVAAEIDCSPVDIVWTSGATEANNLALHHAHATLPSQAEVWLSAIEHPSVLVTARRHFRDRCRKIPVLPTGIIDLDWLTARLKQQKPGLIVVMAANNETGVVQPWPAVAALGREHGVPVFCDAVQAVGKLSGKGLGRCDFVSGSAHKFGGPKGTGFLKCPGRLVPLITGGPQESGRRAGTENVAGVVALSAALSAAAALRKETPARLGAHNRFEEGLRSRLPGSEILGEKQDRLWNTVMALMPEADCQKRWVVRLDKLGFAVSTGSACASGKEEPSHVLAAMKYSPAQAGRVLRFSSGWNITSEDWSALLDALVKL